MNLGIDNGAIVPAVFLDKFCTMVDAQLPYIPSILECKISHKYFAFQSNISFTDINDYQRHHRFFHRFDFFLTMALPLI